MYETFIIFTELQSLCILDTPIIPVIYFENVSMKESKKCL